MVFIVYNLDRFLPVCILFSYHHNKDICRWNAATTSAIASIASAVRVYFLTDVLIKRIPPPNYSVFYFKEILP